MTAYGGNLTVFHRFLFSGASVEDSEVILKGGGLELHYGLGAGPFMSGREQKSKFTLKVCALLSLFKPPNHMTSLSKEEGWFVLNSGTPVPATKAQFMSALSNIEVSRVIIEK